MMKGYIFLFAGIILLAGCSKKQTTVTNPPADEKTDTTVVDESTNAPVTNLPLGSQTDTKTAAASPTPTPMSSAEPNLPPASNTPAVDESPGSSSATDTNPPAANTTGASGIILNESGAPNAPGPTVNPEREKLRKQIEERSRATPP